MASARQFQFFFQLTAALGPNFSKTFKTANSTMTLLGDNLFQSTLPSQGATANIHIKFLCDLLFSTLSSKNSFTLSRFPQTIT